MSASRPLNLAAAAVFAGLLVVTVAGAAPAMAQDSAAKPEGEAPPAATDPQIANLQARRKAAESDSSLSADRKSQVLDLFTRSIDEYREAARVAGGAAELAERIESAPARIEELKALVAREAPEPEPNRYALQPLDQLTTLAREKQQELEYARRTLTAREKELATLTALGTTLSEAIAEQERTLRSLTKDDGTPARPDESPVSREARAAYLKARGQRLAAGIAHGELQLGNYELLVRLATLERDAASVQVPRLDAEREVVVAAVEKKRTEQARVASQVAKSTEAAAASLPAAVAQLGTDNAVLRKELEAVTRKSGEVAERLRTAERQSGELDAELASIRERVETIGGSEAIGRLLRRRLQSLVTVETTEILARRRANEIVQATDRRIDLGEQRRGLADLNAKVDEVIAQVRAEYPAEVPGEEQFALGEKKLREETMALVSATRGSVDELLDAYGRYLTQLRGYDTAERQRATTAKAMLEFIRQELLWIRSIPPLSVSDFAKTPPELARFLSPASWHQVYLDLRKTAASHPAVTILVLCATIALLAMRPWARRKLAALGELASAIRTDAFRHTVIALLLTLALAAPWPVLLMSAGWELLGNQDAAHFSTIAARMLIVVGYLTIFTSALFGLLDREGLARRHFRMSDAVRNAVLRELRWLVPVAILCFAFLSLATADETPGARTAIGRPALMIFTIALMAGLWRLFRTGGPLMRAVRRSHQDRLLLRTWRLWFPLLLGTTALCLIATVTGYHYTARVIIGLLLETGWLVLGISVLRDVLLRWFTVAERRLRFQQALKQREEARAERERAQHEGGEAQPADTAEVEEPEVDFRQLGAQGRAVVRAAVVVGVVLSLWTMWSDLLPALNVLDRLQLPMSRVMLVDGVEQRVAVSVTDVLIGLLVLAGTLFAAQNLSGLLGFTLLRRLTGDTGAQYAIVTLCQYGLVAAGAIYAISSIGVEWSKLQWLVAALGVGLGFGLQEIVANFVSGIILLLERPIRVGDTVTVGDATGTVARIRIRATTIIDWDRKELVVPNKEFITGRLLNWTLSNEIVRLIIAVGVAYGSDVRKARELMLEAAAENEHVLEDPHPRIAFNSFGDNALGLELRVYLNSMDHWLTTQTELHDAIYEKFADAGIVISFPQRDVHLDTNGPIDVRMHAAPESAKPWRPWRRDRRLA